MSAERQSVATRRKAVPDPVAHVPPRVETERTGSPAAYTDITRFALRHAADLMRLQHVLGNQAVGRVIDALRQPRGRLLIQRFTEDDVRKRSAKIRLQRIRAHPGRRTEDEKRKEAQADRAQAESDLKQIEKLARMIAEDRKENPSKYPKGAGALTDWSVAEHEFDLRSNFNLIAGGSVAESGAPSEIALPPTLDSGMTRAMKRSFPKGKAEEQGGVLVRNKNGSYDFKPGEGTDSDAFEPDLEDLGPDQELVGSVHTHPYTKAEGAHTDVSFSADDIFSMVDSGEKVAFLQSGKTQFAISTTAEWNAMLKPLKTPEQKTDLKREIKDTWTTARAAAKG